MEKANKVSVWIGSFSDADQFKKYLEESYDDQGEVSSEFIRDFEIGFYDTDFSESLFLENNDFKALHDFSYPEPFVNEILKYVKAQNSFLVIYDFEYDGTGSSEKDFRFIGSFEYLRD